MRRNTHAQKTFVFRDVRLSRRATFETARQIVVLFCSNCLKLSTHRTNNEQQKCGFTQIKSLPYASSDPQELECGRDPQELEHTENHVTVPLETDVDVVVAMSTLPTSPRQLPHPNRLGGCAAASREQIIDFGNISFLFEINGLQLCSRFRI